MRNGLGFPGAGSIDRVKSAAGHKWGIVPVTGVGGPRSGVEIAGLPVVDGRGLDPLDITETVEVSAGGVACLIPEQGVVQVRGDAGSDHSGGLDGDPADSPASEKKGS